MLTRLDKMRGWDIRAADGDFANVDDFYFDEDRWTVRYILTDNVEGLDRGVLVSPISIEKVDTDNGVLSLSLPRERLTRSPSFNVREPISRRYESDYANYYGYPNYWGGTGLWGNAGYPHNLGEVRITSEQPRTTFAETDRHLKRVSAVTGFHIRALDGEVGHVEDFLADTEDWAIRYLVIDTSNFIGGKTVVLAPDWARNVDWNALNVNVDMSKDQVKNAPEYDKNARIDRDYEQRLYKFYNRPTYWGTRR